MKKRANTNKRKSAIDPAGVVLVDADSLAAKFMITSPPFSRKRRRQPVRQGPLLAAGLCRGRQAARFEQLRLDDARHAMRLLGLRQARKQWIKRCNAQSIGRAPPAPVEVVENARVVLPQVTIDGS